MGEPARKLERDGQRPAHRPAQELRLVRPADEREQAEAWVLEAIMACYCTVRRED